MYENNKSKAYPWVRWIWVTVIYTLFWIIFQIMLTYCFTSGQAVYPQGIPAGVWHSAVVLNQQLGLLFSFVLFAFWNILFSYSWLGGNGKAYATVKVLLPFAVIIALLVSFAPSGILFFRTAAYKNITVAPFFCIFTLIVLPLISMSLFWISVLLFSPDAIRRIGPYKDKGRPTYLGG